MKSTSNPNLHIAVLHSHRQRCWWCNVPCGQAQRESLIFVCSLCLLTRSASGGNCSMSSAQKGPALGLMPCCHQALKLLIIFEQGALNFHCALGLTNDVASRAGWTYHFAAQSSSFLNDKGIKPFFFFLKNYTVLLWGADLFILMHMNNSWLLNGRVWFSLYSYSWKEVGIPCLHAHSSKTVC